MVTQMQGLEPDYVFGGGGGQGMVSFTFGGGMDPPNVTFQPDYVSDDKGPPEEPDEIL